MLETILSTWEGIQEVGNAWWFNSTGAMLIAGALIAMGAAAVFSLRRS